MNVVVSIERMNQEIDGEETESFVSPYRRIVQKKKRGVTKILMLLIMMMIIYANVGV